MSSQPMRKVLALSAFILGAVAATGAASASANGYLSLAVGSASAGFSGSSANDSELAARIAGARTVSSRVGLELGVSFARGFAPPADVLARYPGSHIKVTALDVTALANFPMTRHWSFFAGVGPAMAATRLEVSAARGRATRIQSSLDFTPRFTTGLDFARGDRLAVRFSIERLGPVGSSSGDARTGHSTVTTISLGALIRF